jgi:glycosyltransferase involved in cell wall biosynthesis
MTAVRSERCLIITGMHRSGTSLVAQVLGRAGLHLGDELFGPQVDNPDGLFEDRGIVAFHDRLLAHNAVTWKGVRRGDSLQIPDGSRDRARDLLARKFAVQEVWGWKDPRASLFLDFWRETLPVAKWVLVAREPTQVAWSLVRRWAFHHPNRTWRSRVTDAWIALGLWTTYNERLLAFAARHPGDVTLLLVPADIDRAGPARLDAALARWQLGLRPVAFDGVFVPSLLRTSAPPWLAALTCSHVPSREVWRRLLRLRQDPVSGVPPGGRRGAAPASGGEIERRPVVCVVRPSRSHYSQTFVEAHIRRLPATVKVLHEGYFPQLTQDDLRLLSLGERAFVLVREKFLGMSRRPVERRALARWLRRERVDVVLAEFGQTGAEIWETCEAAGVPLVVHFHGGDAVRGEWRRRYGEAYRRMVRSARRIIVVSRQTEEALAALGAPRDRLVYNPCGADTTLFTPVDPAAAPPHFLAVNRFADKKAPHLTILAFRQVASAEPDARLLMIGDGPLLEACQQLARALSLDATVQFLGALPHAEVAAAMRRVRALVLHSVTTSDGDVEGTPVCVLEAGAAGLPVVATRHAGIADVVVDGETGILVNERDVDGMARAMLRLARDPGLAAVLGLRGRERVLSQFSLDISIARLWEALSAARREGVVADVAGEPLALAGAAGSR